MIKKAFSLFLILLLFAGCTDDKDTKVKICPQCNMQLSTSPIHTCTIKYKGDILYFDDPGCMLLWLKKQKIDTSLVEIKIYATDSNSWIDATKAYYAIDRQTPMKYGFMAHKHKKDGFINFEEMRLRMLRGEHMANPKIRKKLLGY